MAGFSRRKLAEHAATRLVRGDARKAVVKELAAYLIVHHRTAEAELVTRDIDSALASLGHVSAVATSARALTDATKQEIMAYVKAQTDAKNVNLAEVIDESLIGGVKIEYPGHQLDMTIKAKLEKLTSR